MLFKKIHDDPRVSTLIFGCLFLFVGALLLFILADPAYAQFGLKDTAEEAGLVRAGAEHSLTEIIARIVSTALGLVGAIFFVLMIYAGFLWMTARGNEETVKKARGMITNAIIGMIVIAAAYSLTSLIIRSTLGQEEAGSTTGQIDDPYTCSSSPCDGQCNPATQQLCNCTNQANPEGAPKPINNEETCDLETYELS